MKKESTYTIIKDGLAQLVLHAQEDEPKHQLCLDNAVPGDPTMVVRVSTLELAALAGMLSRGAEVASPTLLVTNIGTKQTGDDKVAKIAMRKIARKGAK